MPKEPPRKSPSDDPDFTGLSKAKRRKGSIGGPLPASAIDVSIENGVKWITFKYSRKGHTVDIRMRADIESVSLSALSDHFKLENSLYPSAMKSRVDYKGNRFEFETACNRLGWQLSFLNASLRGQRGLLQRAVDSYRNVSDDPSVHSRRVRRHERRDPDKRKTKSKSKLTR